tara:strand:+ start:69 stop:1583 length:1515 start_codon:yes stop_codon:yes gene_type:complete
VATIEGTGIKTPSKKSSEKATAFLGNFQKKADEKFIKTYESKQEGNIQNSDFETDRYNKLKQKYGDQFSSDASTNFFSPGGGAYDSRNNIETASAGSDFSGLVAKTNTDDGYNQFIEKDFGVGTESSTYKSFPNFIKQDLREQYNDSIKFREGTQINQAPTKEKTIGERVADFTGNVVNTLTGTQSAVAQTKENKKSLFGGSVPEGTYSQFSPTSKPQYQINREKNRPNQNTNVAEAGAGVKFGSVNLNAAKGVESPTSTKTPSEDTSFSSYVRSGGIGQQRGDTGSGDTSFSSYVRGGGEGQERGAVTPQSTGTPRQTVASLPSNYKSTEAEAFRKAAAFKEAQGIAKRNPNVNVGVDSKGQPTATAANDSGEARAQAAAVNRKLSGKSISQVKAANEQSMRDKAAARHETFKKTGKSTVSARRAKAKASMRAAAKKRHSAFKSRREARRRSRRSRRSRSRSRSRRSRRCDIFLKYNISPLTNMNLIRDDLAEVAYFVKEIQE